jgi:hypothetical protein
MDSVLASDCSRDSGGDHLAREVPEGSAAVLDSSVRMAFLGGLRRACLGSAVIRNHILRKLDGKEVVIEKCISQNIARWQLDWRHQVVPE